MNLWNVNTKKEARAFVEAAADPEKIVAKDGAELCRFRVAIPWEDWLKIRTLAG